MVTIVLLLEGPFHILLAAVAVAAVIAVAVQTNKDKAAVQAVETITI
jgi:hypothetical protein